MNYLLFLPVLLGSLVVFQPAINRLMMDKKGLSFVLFANSALIFIFSSLLLLGVFLAKDKFPEFMHPKSLRNDWSWWYILPGTFGFLLVMNGPIAMRSLGAFPTIIAMLAGQLCTSLLWDYFSDGRPLTAMRVIGLCLALGGAYLSFKPEM